MSKSGAILKKGDRVKTLLEIKNRWAARCPAGSVGTIGRVIRYDEVEGENLAVYDFRRDGDPGVWAVTEYDVRRL